jgi:methylmalonic aciduria homocystinuria type C protein
VLRYSEAVIAALAAAGFDVVHAFDTAAVGLAWLADPTRPRGLLIGNTRALWPPFAAAHRDDPQIAGADDPLERYTERAVERAAAELPDARTWYGHRRYGAAFLPFQRLAVAAGLGSMAPTGLVIHPTFGPWFALRAVIACAGEPVATTPIAAVCACDGTCEQGLARATAARGPDAWRAWLAVRDACRVGRAYRYGDDQLAYHYTKNRGLLA